ncbi:MAG TPA: hypothetical protein DEB39_15465 [Planctomycetaceae bacterium]|nr:hypothetical protein [Planctomycetaceae bacterium]
MDNFSQLNLKVPPNEPEHVVRKIELDRKVAVGVEVERFSNGLSTVRLLDATGRPTGNIVRNVVMLPTHVKPAVTTGVAELIIRARKDNPLNFVEIV